jgi:hypothetical protein
MNTKLNKNANLMIYINLKTNLTNEYIYLIYK